MRPRSVHTSHRDESRDHLLACFDDRRFRGAAPQPTHSATARNRTCGDEVHLSLAVDSSGLVTSARFNAKGCIISQAAASLLCEQLQGCTLDEARTWNPDDFVRLLQMPLVPGRRRCALLGWVALKTILAGGDEHDWSD